LRKCVCVCVCVCAHFPKCILLLRIHSVCLCVCLFILHNYVCVCVCVCVCLFILHNCVCVCVLCMRREGNCRTHTCCLVTVMGDLHLSFYRQMGVTTHTHTHTHTHKQTHTHTHTHTSKEAHLTDRLTHTHS